MALTLWEILAVSGVALLLAAVVATYMIVTRRKGWM